MSESKYVLGKHEMIIGNEKALEFIDYNDLKFVVEALKKFKSAEIVRRGDWNVHCSRCDNDDGIYYLVYNKELDEIELVCPDCWFKECFGELPKESKLFGINIKVDKRLKEGEFRIEKDSDLE